MKKRLFLTGILASILAFGMTFTACEATDNQVQVHEDDNTDTGVPPAVAADPGDTADIALVPASKGVNALGLTGPVVIVFSDAAAPAVTGGAHARVNAGANHVTVTLTAAGANIVAQGISAEGSLTFSGDYDFNLYLNGAGLTNAAGAAITNDGTGTMNLTLVEGTANRLIDGAGGSQKSAFYSKGDFAVSGGGSLEVRGKTAHAIAAKGAFTQTGGTIQVKEAAKDGVNAKSVNISGGVFTARTKGDGLQGDDSVT
ncbi:MAG: carbohydrate-binding domain-containing protein, partial [Treponema sp.]|nr:carbohydrate-binding domain-containing protein [Treponema sp.]